jgi:hypothetical protein
MSTCPECGLKIIFGYPPEDAEDTNVYFAGCDASAWPAKCPRCDADLSVALNGV